MPKPKFKDGKLYSALLAVALFVGLTEPPIVANKVEFDEEATEKLNKALNPGQLEELIKNANQELAEEAQADDMKSQLETVLKELDIPQADLNKILEDAKSEGGTDNLSLVKAVSNGLTAYKAENKKKIEQLSNAAEDDTPIDNVIKQKMNSKMKHSLTHLFSSNKDWDALDNSRPWNKAAAEGLTASATDYSDSVTINKLNGDAELYFRENPTEIQSLHRDNFGLPAWFKKVVNVSDRRSSATILTAEITQGRKFGWLPKNVQEIEAEEGRIYPVQIDAQWEGFELQEIETSWLNMMNKEGSQPEKMSFVRFLVGELMKRARVEDRISSLNGIFVQTPKDATVAGKFINRQNGLFYQLFKARDIDQKYRAFSMGEITPQNVYDYFHSDDEANLGFLKRLPQEVLAQTNLVVNIHYKVWIWYKAKYKEINGTNMDFKGLPDHFEDYPNILVETYVDQENPSFVWATFQDNVEILENIVAEKSAYRFQTLLRKIYLLADYKLGVRIVHIGRKVKAGDPAEFKVQSVWSNDVPVFKEDKFIPVYDNSTGIVQVDYKNIQVTDDFATDITEFTGLKAGQVIKVRGSSTLVANKSVVDGAKISLTGDAAFALNTGGTLTLIVNNDLTVRELSRTTSAPTNPSTDVLFTTDSFDATSGSVFRYDGAAADSLADIDNGVNGKTITIYGKTGAALTVEDVAGLIVVGTDVVLDESTKYVELVKVDGIWYKGNTNA